MARHCGTAARLLQLCLVTLAVGGVDAYRAVPCVTLSKNGGSLSNGQWCSQRSGKVAGTGRVLDRREGVCWLKSVDASDGRVRSVFASDSAVGEHICKRVQEIARAAIEEKGGFSMSIGSGTTVKPLVNLKVVV